MSGTHIGGIKAARTRGQGGPGLQQMLRATPEGLCPFCLDELPQSGSRRRVRCDAPECKVAYFRCWRRDERHPPPKSWRERRRQAQSIGQLRRNAA